MLVRVQAAGVNPYETYVRAGRYTELPALPYTPGARRRRRARRHRRARLRHGVAERHLRRVRPVPRGGRAAAAGRPLVRAGRGRSACPTTPPTARCSSAPPRAAGERVLIHGASGGVGLATVQLALAAGLDVTGTAGSEAGSELVAGQGDVRVLDHRDPAHLDGGARAHRRPRLRPHRRVPRQREPRRRPQGARPARPRRRRRQPRHRGGRRPRPHERRGRPSSACARPTRGPTKWRPRAPPWTPGCGAACSSPWSAASCRSRRPHGPTASSWSGPALGKLVLVP